MVKQLLLLILLVSLDLYSKAFFFDRPWNHMEIFPFFSFTLAKNTGASFGLAHDKVELIAALNTFLLLVISYLFFKEKDLKVKIAWMMTLSGGIANLYDRVYLGYVRDFIHLHIGQYSWPIFNLADCYITLAILYLLLHYTYEPSKAK